MRSHGRILVSIWRNREFVARSVEAQRCYMMLLAQKDINNAGVQPWMVRKWAKGCAATSEDDVMRALDELQAHRFVCYDLDTEELFIRSFIRNDGILKQPNMLKNGLRAAEQTESPRLRSALADELDSLRRTDASEVASRIRPEGIGNPFGTLREPLNPSGTPREGCGVGDGEGEVTYVGGQVGGSRARANDESSSNPDPDDPPPSTCPKHNGGTDKPCGACKRARESREAWDTAQARRAAEGKKAMRKAINDCPHCDDIGWILGVEPVERCTHERRSA
jgi:hypothetical protein